MRIGIFIGDANGQRTTVDQLLDNARQAEALGFATGWVPQIPWSLDALVGLALAARVTERIELGTAVMATYPLHPLALARQAASVQAVAGGRFSLGIGPSHPVVIEKMHGLSYEHPVAHLREYVAVLRQALSGDANVAFEGDHYRVDSMFVVPGADTPTPILLAALAPLMLRLAGEAADGTITYWADERAVADHVVPRITAAAEAAGRPAPRVVVGLPVGVCDDEAAGREQAARWFATYEAIPTYQRILARGAGSSPVDVAVIGNEATVRARLQAIAAAGATDLLASPVGLGPDRVGAHTRTIELLADIAVRG